MRCALSHSSLAVLLFGSLAAEDPPYPLYKHRPYLQSLTGTGVLIASQSKEEVVARLRYGPDASMAFTLEEESPGHDHLFRIEGLEPGREYHYQVSHVGVDNFPPAVFRTLPPPGSELHVAAIGDSGTLSDEQLGIAAVLEDLAPHILLHTGDTVYPHGSPFYYYERFFQVYSDLIRSTCIYPSLGNHDCVKGPEYWLYMFHLPSNNPAGSESYYSFDAGDAHFAALNSCHTSDDDPGGIPEEQIRWLDEDLGKSERKWKIVYFHHGPYSNADHGGNLGVRGTLVPVVEKHRVDLVVTGHDHVYERSYPIREGFAVDGFQDPHYVSPGGVIYTVTGGGGASLYDFVPTADVHLSAVFQAKHHTLSLRITPSEIEARALGLEGVEIDRFTIRKDGGAPALSFLRGDANQDGTADITDAISILNYLFTGGATPCLAAADVDAMGGITITDAVNLLGFLFQGGPPPAQPFPGCGSAPGADGRGCVRSCRA